MILAGLLSTHTELIKHMKHMAWNMGLIKAF